MAQGDIKDRKVHSTHPCGKVSYQTLVWKMLRRGDFITRFTSAVTENGRAF